MTRSLALGCAMASVFALLGACSSTAEPGNSVATTAGLSGAATAGTPGSSGSAATSAGAPGTGGSSAGATSAGASSATAGAGAGTGGATAGGTSAGSGGASGGAGGVASTPMNFTCTQFLGLLTTNEWYSEDFEKDGVDGTKYQLKYHHFGYVRTWADPTSAFWGETGNSFDLDQGSSIQSACAASTTAPDRLVFAALDWEMLTKEEWVAALESALVTIKGKYPSLKWIDIMTMIRCPMNKQCNPGANYGPGANPVAGRQDCRVPDFEDAAIAAVAAAHPDFVGVGPKVESPACRSPVDGAHLGPENNRAAAKLVAAYYAMHP